MIKFYAGGKDFDPGISLSELLCDLLFWSRREGVHFLHMLRRAVQVRDAEYLHERLEDPAIGDDSTT
jgi:hypothetical protein